MSVQSGPRESPAPCFSHGSFLSRKQSTLELPWLCLSQVLPPGETCREQEQRPWGRQWLEALGAAVLLHWQTSASSSSLSCFAVHQKTLQHLPAHHAAPMGPERGWQDTGGLWVGWAELSSHIPLLGLPSHSSLLVPDVLGAPEGCRAGAASGGTSGSSRDSWLVQMFSVVCSTFKSYRDLGEGDGRVSPRQGFFAPTVGRAWPSAHPQQPRRDSSSPEARGMQTPKEGVSQGKHPEGLGRASALVMFLSLASTFFLIFSMSDGVGTTGASDDSLHSSLLSRAGRSHRPRCPSIPPGRWCKR